MGVGPTCQTSLSTGLSEWELGPHHAERSPIEVRGRTSLVLMLSVWKLLVKSASNASYSG